MNFDQIFNGRMYLPISKQLCRMMKLVVFFMTCCLVQVSALTSAQVTIYVKNAPLRTVLEQISYQSGRDLIYVDQDLRMASPISLELRKAPLETALKRVFERQPLQYELSDGTIMIKRKKTNPISEGSSNKEPVAQQSIKGKVVNEKGEPLEGATIVAMGNNGNRSSVQTKTDVDGNFELINISEGTTLEISYLGYKTATTQAQFQIGIIVLNPITAEMDEVQIIGYGQTTKRFNTGSVSNISAKEIGQQPVTNVLSAMSGRMPGVFVQTTNGLPGGNINIQIRGTGSIAAGTQPLYIIDGVPFEGSAMSQGSILSTSNIAGVINPLNIINPNDIESITVLKDADATSIYGSRGSNGVVLITTKKGATGGTRISFGINQGYSKIGNFPNLLNLEQYLMLRKEAYANDNLLPSSDPNSSEYAPDLTLWSKTEDTDWSKRIFGNRANLTSSQLSISGSMGNTSFNISGNFRSEGTILNRDNKYKRGGVQSSISHLSHDNRFRLNLTTIFNTDRSFLSNPSNNSTSMFLLPPNYPSMNSDGSYNWYAGSNLDAEAQATSKAGNSNFLTNLSFGYRLPIGLELKISSGYNYRNLLQRQIFPSISVFPGEINYTNFGENSLSSFIIEPQMEFQKSYENSRLQVLMGGTYQNKSSNGLTIKASDFINELLMEDLASASTIDARTTSYIEYKYISAFGRVNYELNKKYVINATVRRDGSSRFGPSSRFGNFFSIGGAWIFSSENWMKGISHVINFGKLRGSYGLTGNDQISDYQYLSTYKSNGSNSYQNIPILKPARIFNGEFQWEVTKKFELAAELGLLQDRIRLQVNYYKNRSNNQLISYTLPSLTGFTSFQANLPAIVQNTGLEIELNTKLLQGSKLKWDLSANLTIPKNKLIDFKDLETSSYANTLRIGEDITRIYGYQFMNVDEETGLAQFTDAEGNISNEPYRYHTIGRRTPSFYGGIGNSFMYGNFQLNLFGQFSSQSAFGNLLFNQFGMSPMNSYEVLLDRWRTKGDISNIPKLSSMYRDDTNYFGQSNGNFFNTTYFRLKTIALSYSFPSEFVKKLGCRDLRISVEGQNMLTVWKKKLPLLDPESGGTSAEFPTIPPVKTFVLGINLSL